MTCSIGVTVPMKSCWLMIPISYLFTDIAKIDLEHHLPVLVDFWDSILFNSDTYRKNAMQPTS